MDDVTPIRRRCDRFFDVSLLTEYSEATVREAVATIPADELTGERSSLIASLMPSLEIKVPTMFWSEAELKCENLGRDYWNCAMTAPMDDPSWASWSVLWPAESESEVDYATDAERGVFVVRRQIRADSEATARQIFAADLDRFKTNLLRTQIEIERYNAALPYLISLWTELRLDGYPVSYEGLSSSNAAIKRELLTEVVDGLVTSGHLMFVEEIDPNTGKLRKRYYHPDHAPKAN